MPDELPVIAKCFDLAKEMTERTRKFPRDLRFVLGDRILATTYDVFDALLEAKYSTTKRPMLDRERFVSRLAAENHIVSTRLDGEASPGRRQTRRDHQGACFIGLDCPAHTATILLHGRFGKGKETGDRRGGSAILTPDS